ncbi:DsbA family oxidoreductase [Sinisalibacter aestuarii]|uniref:Polyketide biosynthesis protein n=1 Tax=Sinisalibacter aestuarii TaxID=2949426 RepID=A0ABQ5LUB0_9RHOB|nr:DsbA family oxidoreductase [Sinisalibacter aestuarii]GKY87936.1 polyketide biosynthesis protein [Sinisalibacter aestuarii]
MVKLVIFSDPVCPWCYIGKARLGRALEQRPDHPFEVEWHPFMLNPDMPRAGMDRRSYLEAKFGGKSGAVDAYMPVVEEAARSGLKLNLDAIARTPNTLDAHRLIHWAGIEGRQTPVVSALFAAYFVEGRDIGDAGELAAIAESCGMDGDMIARLLASDADADDIRARDADARRKGVRAVPTFVVANQAVVPGAQPVELWLNVIDELTGRGAEGPAEAPGAGQTC